MDWQDYAALAITGVAVVVAGRWVYRSFGGSSSCASGCGSGEKATGLKRTPLTTLKTPGDPTKSDTND